MSDNEYTPTTDDVQRASERYMTPADFRRWLAAHDAQVREEGARAMREAAVAVLARSIHDLNEALIDAEPLTADEDADAAQALGMLGRIEGSIRALPISSTGVQKEA